MPRVGTCPGASVRQVLNEEQHASLVLETLGYLLVNPTLWVAFVATLLLTLTHFFLARLAAVGLALGTSVQLAVLPVVRHNKNVPQGSINRALRDRVNRSSEEHSVQLNCSSLNIIRTHIYIKK